MVSFHLIVNVDNEAIFPKGKVMLWREVTRGLKLLDHVMKGMERVIEKIIRERISIDDMQFGFMPDAIFILRQLQEKHLAKNKKLYFAFVDLEKAFDRVPRKVIWTGHAKTWHRGMDCVIRAVYVQQHQKQSQ